MTFTNRHFSIPRGRAALVAATLSALALAGAARADADPAMEPAISRPHDESQLKFAAPGLISEVMVKEGDHVTAGQVMAQQDDRQEQVALRSLEMDADSTAEIEYEKKAQILKQVQYDRKKKGREDLINAQSEVEEALDAVELAVAQIKVAELKHDKTVLDAAKQRIKVEQMQLKSPIDGVVEVVNTHPGEMADPQAKDGAIVVVKNDPLWVEFHLATDRAMKLQPGQELQVRIATPPGEPASPWQQARVIYFAPKADASSKTELVRLELPNPSGQRSGLSMEVRLPANVAAIAAADGPAPAPVSGTLAPLPPLSQAPSANTVP